jgi:DNA modification methylase
MTTGNELYYGDNLDVLRRKVGSESVDLCYIDPPFNSKRNYFQIYNNQGGEDRAQAQAFVDTWNWGDDAIKGLDYILDIERLNPRAGDTRWTEQTVELKTEVDISADLSYVAVNRTPHASASVCAPGGSFFGRLLGKAGRL